MSKDELETIRRTVRMEVERIIGEHLSAFGVACLSPLSEAVAMVLERQILIEKALAALGPDDDEPWRESLSDD